MTISRDKAVLVSLNVSIWTANKLDRDISEEVASQKKLKDAKLGRYWKSLLPKNDYFASIHGIAAKARKFHYSNTFAWVQEGARILPTRNYLAYMDFMRATKSEYEKAIDAFLSEYGQLQKVAKEALNSIFKKSDYPSVDKLRSKFSFETFVTELPAGATFTADVGDEESQRIREDIEKSVQDAFRSANRDLWDRMYSTINKVQERLADPKGARESSLRSLRDMLGLLDRLNISGDQRLEKLRKQAEERLSTMSLQDFKSNEAKRSEATAGLARIQESMAAFMGGSAHGG